MKLKAPNRISSETCVAVLPEYADVPVPLVFAHESNAATVSTPRYSWIASVSAAVLLVLAVTLNLLPPTTFCAYQTESGSVAPAPFSKTLIYVLPLLSVTDVTEAVLLLFQEEVTTTTRFPFPT